MDDAASACIVNEYLNIPTTDLKGFHASLNTFSFSIISSYYMKVVKWKLFLPFLSHRSEICSQFSLRSFGNSTLTV
jgi:hypothetical protein